MKLLINKFSYQKYGPNVIYKLYKYVCVYISFFISYTLYEPLVHRRSQGGPRSYDPSKFLEYLVILCFKRQHLKQITVARLNLTF